MAERSKALVLGTSHCGGAGSNPVLIIRFTTKNLQTLVLQIIEEVWVPKLQRVQQNVVCQNFKFRNVADYFYLLERQVLQVGWPSGLRRWFKAPVISMARVRIPPSSHLFGS